MTSSRDPSPLFLRTIALISAIPRGRVTTYGQVAELIGAPGCARHISYILSSSSKKYDLPWHRVMSAKGKIPKHRSHRKQVKLLLEENVEVQEGHVELTTSGWRPTKKAVQKLLNGLPKHRSI